MTATHSVKKNKKVSPSNPTPEVVKQVLRPLSIRDLLRIRREMKRNPQRHAVRIKILDSILAERTGHPIFVSEEFGPMLAVGKCKKTGQVTYQPEGYFK